jgi:hypothetical protein
MPVKKQGSRTAVMPRPVITSHSPAHPEILNPSLRLQGHSWKRDLGTSELSG